MEKTYLLVKEGKIEYIGKEKPTEKYNEFIETKSNQMIIPGLIDTHIHSQQYIFSGTGLDLPLLEWMNKYTFPAEAKFSDLEHAKKIYEAVVKSTLSFGTTTANYFASLFPKTANLLAEICTKLGQRTFIGKESGDMNLPNDYIETTEEAIQSAKDFVANFNYKNSLVQPILTPIFVPTCSPELLKALGDIAEKNNVLIQTHLDESLSEIEWVKKLHPSSKSYTHVYDEYGILRKGTVLAHCVHITDEELQLIKERNSGIAHCPSSNFILYSGIADVRHMIDMKINVGLGTDVAGGPSPSIVDSMRNALICSRANLFQKRKEGKDKYYKPLTTSDVLFLATEGGANTLNISNKVGNFLLGKEFDALLVDMNKGQCDCFYDETPLNLLDKFVQRSDDRNIIKVFVQGKIVKNII